MVHAPFHTRYPRKLLLLSHLRNTRCIIGLLYERLRNLRNSSGLLMLEGQGVGYSKQSRKTNKVTGISLKPFAHYSKVSSRVGVAPFRPDVHELPTGKRPSDSSECSEEVVLFPGTNKGVPRSRSLTIAFDRSLFGRARKRRQVRHLVNSDCQGKWRSLTGGWTLGKYLNKRSSYHQTS